jgi:transposase
MDWVLERLTRIEKKLAKTHLKDGKLVLFDVSSRFYTGKKSSLITHGDSRDHRSIRSQIVYGLLCDPEGCLISVDVFPSNTPDPKASTSIVAEVRKRFGIKNVVFTGAHSESGAETNSVL